MIIGVVKETCPGEKRIALTPPSAGRLRKKGAQVLVESGLGQDLHITTEDFESSGARVLSRLEVLSQSDVLLKVRKPEEADIASLKNSAVHISFLDPFHEKNLLKTMAARGIRTISLEMIPRVTIAQKMDALSSQANLAGYIAVVIAAERLGRVLPMMMTPAGTISPARVLVIGAGVAGLQAIATAKRLGARVEAFDTRAVVKEQVQSLGAKFVEIDVGETGQTKDGYARSLTPEQIEKQRAGLTRICAQSDIVITTAQVFGKKAPLIITKEMISAMRSGSVIVDGAVESGGNVEGTEADREITLNGVRLIGIANLPSRVAAHASEMFANNLVNFIEHFWDKDLPVLHLPPEDPIIKGCLLTDNGNIIKTDI
ncbi:MAG: Re/Si-specific NAD(P)(+) transhydrogenase subunit alpha [Elusimicrobia bacterium]|nr:Re/Si-specific NAD(P)(+) transhydrogenase subunit alpha [Elusimicrobiota bacterium]